MNAWTQFRHLLAALCFAALAGGCATTASTSATPGDPWEGMNRAIFDFNDGFDRTIFKPVATGYKTVMPEPARQCVSNIFANVGDVLVSVNSLLQGKVGDAVSDACRVLVNTTVGIAGCFDVASKTGLEKHNRDFGQTFGKWGVPAGPYVVLPVLGASNVRDTGGYLLTNYLDPIWNIPHVPTRNVVVVARAVSIRADLLSASNVLEEAALDKYSFVRDAYMQRRQSMIEDDDNAGPAQKGEKPAAANEGRPLPLAYKGAVMPTPSVPAELWFDQANQRTAASGERVEVQASLARPVAAPRAAGSM